MVKFISSGDTLTVFIQGVPWSLKMGQHPSYQKVKAGLTYLTEEELKELVDIPQSIQRSLVDHRVTIRGNTVYLDGEELHSTLAERLIQFIHHDFPVQALVRFTENLYKNTSDAVIKDLYDFLEKNQLPVTENGSFLAYKNVREDYLDFHSCTYLNTPGSVIEMPKEKVNPDSSQSCSYGLHVGSPAYFGANFRNGNLGTFDGRMMVVEVFPQDVVAVPEAYSATKMRVCKYKVLHEINSGKRSFEDKLSEDGFQPVEKTPVKVPETKDSVSESIERFLNDLGFTRDYFNTKSTRDERRKFARKLFKRLDLPTKILETLGAASYKTIEVLTSTTEALIKARDLDSVIE